MRCEFGFTFCCSNTPKWNPVEPVEWIESNWRSCWDPWIMLSCWRSTDPDIMEERWEERHCFQQTEMSRKRPKWNQAGKSDTLNTQHSEARWWQHHGGTSLSWSKEERQKNHSGYELWLWLWTAELLRLFWCSLVIHMSLLLSLLCVSKFSRPVKSQFAIILFM